MRELKAQAANYKLLEVLGHGQSATVFKAIREDDRGHSRQVVALKILKGSAPVPWLRHEFETLARVKSRHCVRLIAWENFSDGSALALELVDGVTLLRLGQSGRLGPHLIGEIVAQIQDGLRELAEHGLHHGDLSPCNILIDREGWVRLVDFGLGTDRGARRGTPAYLAPEIWDGHDTNFATDLFALGLMVNDLRDGFQNVPAGLDACRDRAMSVAREDSDLLSLRQERRVMQPVRSDDDRRRELAALVEQTLLATPSYVTATMPPPRTERKFRLRLAVSIALLIAVSTLSVQAGAPIGARRPLSTVSIRSQKWLKIAINGRDVGYAPVQISDLAAGVHRIAWTSSSGAGETVVAFPAGANLRLTDIDLERLAASRDH